MTELTKDDLNNLLVFLSRANLTGNEAIVMVKLVEKINKLTEHHGTNGRTKGKDE